jgi:hypothetical protein
MKRYGARFFVHFWKLSACAWALLALGLEARGQLLNNWTNTVSARWESSTNWSLGMRPASSQTVNITNAGYKAVNIDAATISGFPDSMTVSNLSVAAPTNSLSTLLLNYAGLGTPLKVLNDCTIRTNGTIANYYSSFEMDGINGGQLRVDGGTFVQQDGQTVVNAPVFVVNNGSVNTTNANLTLGRVTIGSAPASVGSFIQNGGSIAAQQIDVSAYDQDPFGQGGYELFSGVLYAIEGTQCSAAGPGFRQFGGTNYGNITATDGYYALLSGMAQGNVLTAASPDGNASLFDQEGGLLDMQFINISGGSNWPPQSGPWFAAGTVHCGTLNIGGNARVELRGADFFVTNNFDLHGMEFNVGGHGPLIEHVACHLWAGHLYLPSMSLGQYAFFNEMGGSNKISGPLSLFGGQFSLYGGTLETTYTGVGLPAAFVHAGGQHFVHGVLSITGTYALNGASPEGGCNLVCQGLYLRGALTMTLYDNGRYFDPAATITNTGLLNLGGTISTELPDAELGQVQLATNALMDLSIRFPAVVRFANSSAVGWTPGALLVITNWSSSDHVFAGNDASGLSASQLQQVEFVNPAGFAPGAYPAQILSTGQIVPGQRPTLAGARIPNALVLTWSGSYQLLSATNVTGPYLPVSGATSPWTNFFNVPHQFFRLQSSP